LIGGGLVALQTAAVSTGLPFAIVLLLIIYALYIGFSQKLYVEDAVKCSLKQVEEEHRLAVAIEIASSDDEECEAKEI
jgi:choline/glycine/proline betaine transport protein